ncbi:MAG: hypothetical protein JXR70_02245 [Spirochaetales bacterium]|nr:hypothetical protein [Spirochaetales bacterium]
MNRKKQKGQWPGIILLILVVLTLSVTACDFSVDEVKDIIDKVKDSTIEVIDETQDDDDITTEMEKGKWDVNHYNKAFFTNR